MKVWILYADACKDAQTVFDHMAAKQIGSQLEIFYVARAATYETSENFGAAERALEEGLRKGAEPVERLQKRLKEFQHRMVKRTQAGQESQPSKATSKSSKARSKSGRSRERSSLQQLGSRAARTGRRPMSRAGDRQRFGGTSRTNAQQSSSSAAAAAGGNFQIFDDSSQSAPSAASDGAPAESVLQTHSQRHKENQATASIWTECTVKQRADSDGPPRSSGGFDVFVDEGSQATGPTEASTRREGLREHLDEPAQPTAVTQVCPALTNPAKTESHTASKLATSSAESQGLAIFEDNTVNSKPDDCAATASPPTVNTATMHDGEPTMTIDTRAALGEVCGMFSGRVARTESDASCASERGVEAEAAGPEHTVADACGHGQTPLGEQSSAKGPGAAVGGGFAIFEDNAAGSMATDSGPDGEPTMTIDTRAALGEVCGMFSAPLGATTSADSCASSVGGGETGFTIFTD